ncbi:heavy-metal-associated domain-containing protein [Sphingomonas aracearum]|uniref:Heavy-metal-associated domain-containing protein n=1 Tax=Sphingomonas aracearum TaxID=2283317 RepID=A0A369VXK6_9SPHN|nr:heavy-metal-associated domain-containing protein [Sphingomonas aracearum]RDE06355.1 heavy-metal-associated domain-containing protein [Sphingomonas aracearum]
MSVRPFRPLPIALALACAATGGVVLAQIENANRGVAPVDSSRSYEVGGVQVDVTGKTAEEARYAGWRLAQRRGWQMLTKRLGGGPMLPDGALNALVTGIVVEHEQIGPTRYVARLGVLFDRGRASSILGVVDGSARSAPMLVLPLEVSGGAETVFEQRSLWQQAWARFRTGTSAVDYVRPSGGGPDALLLNAGQISRPSRGWWRTVLDLYGAEDMLFPVVRLQRQWPGGPVIGVFQARHGPDNRALGSFTLRVSGPEGIPALLDAGVKRLDAIYSTALSSGQLAVDPSLAYVPPPMPVDETVTDEAGDLDNLLSSLGADTGTAAVTITLQYETPAVGAVTSTEAAVRSIPGVSAATTTSLALGGVSVMRVTYDADPALLRTSLEQRGWTVSGQGAALRIRRGAAPTIDLPAIPADNATAG